MSKIQEWNTARKQLKKDFEINNVVNCEARLQGCFINWGLGFAHTKKRRYITDLKRVALLCNSCHQKIEYDCEKWTGKTMEEYIENLIQIRTTT